MSPNSVPFTSQGYPDFSAYAGVNVQINGLTGNRGTDERLANRAAGLVSTPDGYTWHHVEDGKTMQLIPEDLHNAVKHTGGAAIIKQNGGGQ